MIIALTGASGNMGGQALAQALELPFVTEARVLLSEKRKTINLRKNSKGGTESGSAFSAGIFRISAFAACLRTGRIISFTWRR